MLLVLALLACKPAVDAPVEATVQAPVLAPGPLRFVALPAATAGLEQAVVTPKALWGGREIPVTFTPLLYTGDQPGSSPHPVGTMLDSAGAPLAINRHPPYSDLCNELDFAGILQSEGKPWLISHVECGRGALWRTELAQDAQGGLTAVQTAPLATDDIGGIWNPCSGMITPWGTMLSSEEYEPDARWIGADSMPKEKDVWGAWNQYVQAFPAGKVPSPYRSGWIPEVRVLDGTGATEVVKHGALGRFSHEIGYVLPDRRTVYLSDDGTHMGWFMFVADKADDLSAGLLYAARWTVESNESGGRGALAWIPLGHATDADVEARIASGVVFSDLFDAADPKPDGTCGDGLTLVRTPTAPMLECIRLKPAIAADPKAKAVAARLETRRVAALEGATVELNKGEGVAFDEAHGTVFLALSDISKSMGAEEKVPAALDLVKVARNRCGGVYGGAVQAGVSDTTGQAIPSDHVMTRLDAVIVGTEQEDGKSCAPEGIANPDNLAFVHGHGLLLVAEDTDRHVHNALWAYDVAAKELVRVLEAPDGGEVTGIHWYPDIGGYGYISATIQHPFGDEGGREQPVPFAQSVPRRRSHQGVIGPFPTR